MNTLKGNQSNRVAKTHLAWLLPILALSPLALAAKGCDNSGVVGNNCATPEDCPTGNGGKGGGTSTPGGECGGLLGKTCNADQYCDFPADALCGNADQTGTCKARPDACDDIYSPVCGCDGKTYSNDCEANGNGVSVASSGECGGGTGGSGSGGSSSGGGDCGGFLPGSCPKDQYCNFPVETQCGSGDQTGSCTPIPQGCSKELNQVCGCDSVTYGNPCMAAAAGVSIAHQGACTTGGKACGEIGGCAADEFCNFPPESMCGFADGPGVCTKLPPKGSACDAVYDPVCGCDGKTYGNDCTALLAGVSVSHTGECASDCGGFAGAQCNSGLYCNYALDQMCGAADGVGKCTAIPDACPDNVDPVCGCDGKDYFNACEAAAKGTAVAAKGACKK